MGDSPSAERRLGSGQVRALLKDQAPLLASAPLKKVAEGWDNAIWRLGADLAVRLPRRAEAARLIGHENTALPMLAPRLARVGVLSPVPVVCGEPSGEFPWPWSIVPWLPGAPALAQPRDKRAAWAPKLARALEALHRPAPTDAPVNPLRGVPLQARETSIRERLERHPEHAALGEHWDAGLAVAPSRERVWIHGDLHPGNLLVHHGDLAAIIDFGDVTAGDAAYDLACGWMLFDDAGREHFHRATQDRYDASTWVRARAWAAGFAVLLLDSNDDRPELRRLGQDIASALSAG